jgi:molybdopterin/thiamine biosynthesis adenylyltransferase
MPTANEIERYSRHLLSPDVGVSGQRKLWDANVLCVGVGGLGPPLMSYLATAFEKSLLPVLPPSAMCPDMRGVSHDE